MSIRVVALLTLAAIGCGPRVGVRIEARGPSAVIVGEEARFSVRAAKGAELDFSVEASLTKRPQAPTLTQLDGEGTFRWTPLGIDVGDHAITFIATRDGVASDATVMLTVVEPLSPITFRQPLGAGTTFALDGECIEVPLAVDDATASAVTFSPGEGWPEPAVIMQSSPLGGSVVFCPDADVAPGAIYTLVILADDVGGAHAEKRYTLVAEVGG